MDNFALVDAIRSYCENENIYFIYGDQAYQNAATDEGNYSAYDLILIADFTCVPVITGGRVVQITYTGTMALGRKFESETESSLDETPIQKYDRRLKTLSSQLANIIGEISCDNELDVSGLNFRFDLNQFDLNADFVATTIQLTQ